MREKVIVTVSGGAADVVYSSKDIDVYIFNLDEKGLYLYKDKYICEIESVNENGTVNLICVDTTDGSRNNGHFLDVSPENLWFYGLEDEEDELIMEDW